MPYEGEYAGYLPLRRVAESERVRQLLQRSRVYQPSARSAGLIPKLPLRASADLPDLVVAIDGSYAEVDVKNGYPGAKVGYCTVASVLVNRRLVASLDEDRPADPKEFRRTEEAATIDAAVPGSNVVTSPHMSARAAFRECIYETLQGAVVDADDRTSLLDTYEELLKLRPTAKHPRCPYQADGCDKEFPIGQGVQTCPCPHARPVYSTDALRIHEGFRDLGTNGEALAEVMQVWERVLLVHLLRCFERRQWLDRISRVAFIVDGPLAVFGHPAWLSAAISSELKRLNSQVRTAAGLDLMIIGVEKGGDFVTHFEEVDRTETPGETRFGPGTYALPTDTYIKSRIIFSDPNSKRYGLDTYFGRKFFYKTRSGARIVAGIPFLDDAQDTLDSDDATLYPALCPTCALLDELVSARYPNALAPVVSAHSHAAIPLNLGARVLEQLAKALVRQP